MEGMIVLLVSTITGGIGWWIGARVGITTAFIVSIVGTAAGVYLGRKFARDYLP